MLDGAVVELLCDPSSLRTLRKETLGDEMVAAQSIIASRSAMATAWVRVSASSFARMWRTWLFISQETVKSHVRHILAKLEAETRTQAVAIALREAMID